MKSRPPNGSRCHSGMHGQESKLTILTSLIEVKQSYQSTASAHGDVIPSLPRFSELSEAPWATGCSPSRQRGECRSSRSPTLPSASPALYDTSSSRRDLNKVAASLAAIRKWTTGPLRPATTTCSPSWSARRRHLVASAQRHIRRVPGPLHRRPSSTQAHKRNLRMGYQMTASRSTRGDHLGMHFTRLVSHADDPVACHRAAIGPVHFDSFR